jgi:rhodanese-related sulfurtransferase
MTAVNHLDGLMPLARWDDLAGALLVDVREPEEYASGHADGALNLPLSRLRRRYIELPRDRRLALYCAAGQRGYYATRFLLQQGYDAANLSGGYTTYRALRDVGLAPAPSSVV